MASSAIAQTPAAAPAAASAAFGPALVAPTVAVVDIQRVLGESAAGRSIQSQLDTERRKIRDQVSRLEEDLKTSENDLKRKRSVMQPDEVNEQVQALQRKQAEAQRVVQDRQESFQKGESEAVNVVGDNMRDLVQQYAAERHIGMVLRKELVISMADKNMDITDEIISRLNAKLPSVTVTVTPPGGVPAGPVATGTQAPAPAAPVKAGKK
jgi:Skp family chaperone for outer membrane proteins